MSGLALAWRYLTGHSVATDISSRDRPEWPPHPARVFMALAAAWFETEPDADDSEARRQWEAEGEALRWLERLGDPVLHIPADDRIGKRKTVTVFVAVNDEALPGLHRKLGKKKLEIDLRKMQPIQACPSLRRIRQPRTFPMVWVGENPCLLEWPGADSAGLERHRSALQRLCAKVTRIGHSSSLVQMWIAGEDTPGAGALDAWEHGELATDLRVRPVSDGLLAMLEERYGEGPRRRAASLAVEIETLKSEIGTIRGKGARERKQRIREEIEDLKQKRAQQPVRSPMRPMIGVWRGYRRVATEGPVAAASSVFDQDLLVLALGDRPSLPAAATLLVTTALRNAILRGVHDRMCGCQRWKQSVPVPEQAAACWSRIPAWVSGHEPDGSPLRSGEHLAIIALPFVGSRHADGHLLGVALAFPRAVARSERGCALGPVLLGDDGLPRPLRLSLGRAGTVEASLRDPSDTRSTLLPQTWTSLGRQDGTRPGSTVWASATPVVLDRFPKTGRRDAPAEWRTEVSRIVSSACLRVGLPQPVAMEVGTTSWLRGSPRAFQKRRPLRTAREKNGHADGPLGDGFPFLAPGNGGAPRPQVHARIEFPVPVVGPVLLGAGRFRGYGLFRPVWGTRR